MAWRFDPGRRERQMAATERRLLAEMDAMDRERHGVCYFIGCEEGLVKIGHTRNLPRRLAQLRSTAIFQLTVLAIANGGRSRELHYHRKFWSDGIGGEWFNISPAIEAEIVKLTASPVPGKPRAQGCGFRLTMGKRFALQETRGEL